MTGGSTNTHPRCRFEAISTHRRALACLALVTGLVVVGVTGTPSDWWFEDDTVHRVFVRDHPGPWSYFTPNLVADLSLGQAVTPWFAASFWIDHQISTDAPMVAYLHTALSLYLTAAALYFTLARFTTRTWAVAAIALWLFLPSTVVITEFLSTRHYLEGLLFAVAGVWCGLESRQAEGHRRAGLVLLAAVLYLLACSAKEVYVTAAWFFLMAVFVESRRWSSAVLLSGCGVLYAAYRILSLGGLGRALDLSFAGHYHLFVLRWPQILTGNRGGYLVAAMLAVVVFELVRRRWIEARHLIFVGAMLVIMAATIFPVTANVTYQYRSLGPWFRVVFLLNTFALLTGGWMLSRLRWRGLAVAVAVASALVIIPGGVATAGRWDELKAEYRREARFYLDHPDRLLYSRLPAPWFLYGVHHLYRTGEQPHFITWRVDRVTTRADIESRTRGAHEVWVFDGGTYRGDPQLLEVIIDNAENGVDPLHRGWSGTNERP